MSAESRHRPSDRGSATQTNGDAASAPVAVPLWRSLRCDVLAHIPLDRRPASRAGVAALVLRVALRSSGFRCGAAYRVAHTARCLGMPGRIVAAALFWWCRHWYGCAIAPTARIHGGLILPHPQGIVIGPGVVVGSRAWIFQNVTIGGAPGRAGVPRVGADARVYAGAVITGPVVVGDNVMVGANAVVSSHVPDRMLVRAAETIAVPLPDRFIASAEHE